MLKKTWIPSPFFEDRGSFPLDMIVIHHIGSKDGKLYSVPGTITWFTDINVHKNKDTGKIENKVSAHYILPREPYKGYDLIHLVEDLKIAYHAGESQWVVDGKTRKYINRYSIGIEMEGDGNLVEYTDFQYEKLTELIKEFMTTYNIPEANIVGHEDIAPDRKIDPGKLFDWKRLRQGLAPTPVISIPTPVVVIPDSPSSQPSKPPEHVPDEEFHMGDGSKSGTGGIGKFFSILFDIFLKIFRIQ